MLNFYDFAMFGFMKWIIIVAVIIIIGGIVGLPTADYLREVMEISDNIRDGVVDTIDNAVNDP